MSVESQRRQILTGSLGVLLSGMVLKARAEAQTAAPTGAPPPRPPISAYAATPLVDEIALSPDGTRIAIVTQKGDDKVLFNFRLGEKPKLHGLGPLKVRSLFWADNQRVVLINSQTAALRGFVGRKHEFSLARVIDLNTAKLRTLFSNMEDFYNVVLGNLQRIKIGGKYYVTASNYKFTGDGNLCLYRFDLDSGIGIPLVIGSGETNGFIIAPDGRVMAYADYNDEYKTWELYFNKAPVGKTQSFKAIYKIKNAYSYPDLIGISSDGEKIVIFVNDDDGGGDYYNIGADGVLSEPLDKSDIKYGRGALFHPTTGRFVGFSRHNDWFTYEYTDPLMKKLADAIPQVLEEGYRFSMVDHAEDPRKMIVFAERRDDPGSYFHIDFSTGAATLIARKFEDIPPEWVSEKKAIDYKAADGLNIHAYLTLPPFKTHKDLPLVVMPHGGPQSRDYIDYDWQAQALASLGYAVLQPNFRGSSGYGAAFTEAGHGEFGRKMQTDLSDGVRHLVKQGLVDPKRVAIVGASYGGYAALAGATLDRDVYNCAISIAGVADPKTFVDFVASNTVAGKRSERALYWKEFLGDPKTYDQISPVKQAAQASCPILLIHGQDDTVVPIDQSRRMEKALKEAGKPVELITYKGQDHWETIESARLDMMNRVVTFLGRHNPA